MLAMTVKPGGLQDPLVSESTEKRSRSPSQVVSQHDAREGRRISGNVRFVQARRPSEIPFIDAFKRRRRRHCRRATHASDNITCAEARCPVFVDGSVTRSGAYSPRMTRRTLDAYHPSCPKCSMPHPRRLEYTSLMAGIDSFQCTACAHLWPVPRSRLVDSHS